MEKGDTGNGGEGKMAVDDDRGIREVLFSNRAGRRKYTAEQLIKPQ